MRPSVSVFSRLRVLVRAGVPRCNRVLKLAGLFAALNLPVCLLPGDGHEPIVLCAQEPSRTASAAQIQQPIQVLEPGQPIECELPAGIVHRYSVSLDAGEFFQAVVEQRGIDVVVALLGPTDQKLIEVDGEKGPSGSERILVVAEATGSYYLEIRAFQKESAAGRYEARIEERRPATTQHRSRAAAERAFSDGEQQRAVGTAESLRSAIERYEAALPHWHAAGGDDAGEAKTILRIGTSYYFLGELQKALDFYSRALPRWRAAGDRRREADTLNNIGVAYRTLGEPQKALDVYTEVLQFRQAAGDRLREADALHNIGVVYRLLGEPQKALDAYTEALHLRRAAGRRQEEAGVLNNIGIIYDSLGEPQRAIESYTEALSLHRAARNQQGEAETLYNMATAYDSLGEHKRALEIYLQALQLSRVVGYRWAEANTLRSIGKLYSSLGEHQTALDFLDKALTLHRAVGDRGGEAYALTQIGKVYGSSGESRQALDYLNRALTLNRATGYRAQEAEALAAIARVERDGGNLSEARAHSEAALVLVESLRTRVASQDLRASFLAAAHEHYYFYIDLLMRLHQPRPSAGFDALALHASERARARSLLDLLTEAHADIRQGVNPDLLERGRSLQQRLNAKAERQMRLVSGAHTEEQAAAIEKEIAALTTEYQEVQGQIRATSPRYAALTQPTPVSLAEIQQLLDPDTLLLEYALGEERSYVWAVTPTALTSAELPKRSEIDAVARRLYDLLTAPQRVPQAPALRPATASARDAEYWRAASALSQMVLGPVASQLSTKRVLVVSDGALQYVPFGALPIPSAPGMADSAENESAPRRRDRAGDRRDVATPDDCAVVRAGCPLIAGHEVVSLPSASALAVLRRQIAGRGAAPKQIAVLADPVFHPDDARVRRSTDEAVATRGQTPAADAGTKDSGAAAGGELSRAVRAIGLTGTSGRIPRLPFSRREAEQILALVPGANGLKAMDFQASRTTATTALSEYRIVHFATHGLINSEHPELSGLVLSLVNEHGEPQDGFVRLHDIYNLSLPADLVVLSACQTALGKAIKGEGLVGLTRGFLYAGAARVVASLWKVDDPATAELMTRFYRAMLHDGLRPAAALRQAQVEIWRQKRWQAPYYWAGFVLQGEWR